MTYKRLNKSYLGHYWTYKLNMHLITATSKEIVLYDASVKDML